MRIISLVPSITELLFTLNLNDEVVGITKFCIHPNDWFRSKTRVGGTKQLNIQRIRELNPTLIIANKEENTREDIELLQQEFTVHLTDISSLQDAFQMITTVGELTHRAQEASAVVQQLQPKFSDPPPQSTRKALYLIWQEPFMAAGTDTFIHQMMLWAGFSNVLKETRYPVVSTDQIQQLAPEYILLSSEPFPFQEKHRVLIQQQFPASNVVLVDGEIFSWYGSRMLLAKNYFRQLNESLEIFS